MALQAWVKFCWRGAVRIRLADSRTSAARWDGDNAEAMLALAALDHSRLWTDYWRLQRAA